MQFMGSIRNWVRRNLGWSNTRHAWEERTASLGWLVGVILLVLLTQGVMWWWRIVLFGAWVGVLGVLVRGGWVKLFGPTFVHELRRGSRKRVQLTRTAYGMLLLGLLTYFWIVRRELLSDSIDSAAGQARLAETFFAVFMAVQGLIVLFMTPATVAGCIAEEKEKRTLDYLLATDLRGHEIISGKLGGRLANLVLFLLTGLPVLSILQLIGGIDPGLLLAGFAGLALTMLGLAGLSIACSVRYRRPRDAVSLTFLILLAYMAITPGLWIIGFTRVGSYSITLFGRLWTWYDLVDLTNGGNPAWAVGSVIYAISTSKPLGDVLWPLLTRYSVFQLTMFAAGTIWSSLRLRSLAMRHAEGVVRRKRDRSIRRLKSIGSAPMYWKEVYLEYRRRVHPLMRLVGAIVILLSFVPAILIVYQHWREILISPPPFLIRNGYSQPLYAFRRELNVWARIMSILLGTIGLISVAVRASGSIAGERAKMTLNELLTTPLSCREIILSKWYGSIVSARRFLPWVISVAAFGFLFGAVSIFGIIAVFIAWVIYAGFFSAIGIFLSASENSTTRSSMATLGVSLFCLGGHWAVGAALCYVPFSYTSNHEIMRLMAAFQFGFTPPCVFAITPIVDIADLIDFNHHEFMYPFFSAFNLIFWIAGMAAILVLAHRRLVLATNRAPIAPRKPSMASARPSAGINAIDEGA
jgi:ABC-type transport system involved in multi-copper enzyme maturation permease subunit